MIPQSDLSWQTQSWQEQMMNAIQQPDELLRSLGLAASDLNLSSKAAECFSVNVPQSFLSRITPEDPLDPLLRQVLNLQLEDIQQPGYTADPLDESNYNPIKGLVRKYKNRALLIVTGKCAIHCRYCFRRNFPYAENNPSRNDWQQAFNYLREQPEIDEIILSGGDPMSAPDKHLLWLTNQLSEISSIKRLRFHTRLPVVIPDRVTPDFLELLQSTRLSTTVVVHINHANEIDDAVSQSLLKIKTAANFLLNQSVLLAGVNDNLDTQIALQEACVQAGVMPYYLHLLDSVMGAAHFQVPEARVRKLYSEMQASLSGYMLPRLVIEEPGATSKQVFR